MLYQPGSRTLVTHTIDKVIVQAKLAIEYDRRRRQLENEYYRNLAQIDRDYHRDIEDLENKTAWVDELRSGSE